jgi:hypothetical protein
VIHQSHHKDATYDADAYSLSADLKLHPINYQFNAHILPPNHHFTIINPIALIL